MSTQSVKDRTGAGHSMEAVLPALERVLSESVLAINGSSSAACRLTMDRIMESRRGGPLLSLALKPPAPWDQTETPIGN